MSNVALIAAGVLLLGSVSWPSVHEQVQPAPAPAAVTVPDTPAGRGLQGFVASFNAGGEKRQAWLKESTTMDAENAAGIFEQDLEVLQAHGPMTIVRLPQAAQTTIVAIVNHVKTGLHGHLTIEVEADAPHRIANVQLRGATPEEIKEQ